MFRRTLLALVAAAAMLFGFGAFTAALACPVAYAGTQDHSDCCGQAEREDCVLLNCTAICHAVAPDAPDAQSEVALTLASFWGSIGMLETVNTGPEPPPPRFA